MTDARPKVATGAAARPVDVRVDSELDVHRVVAAVTTFCDHLALSTVLTAHVATAASELANNLWMHARVGGHIRLALVAAAGGGGDHALELCAVDCGPGIADVALALTEGYSTAGGLGCGLPGVQRLMDEFSIESAAGSGTRVVTRKWLPAPA